jgi:hypothetical protein
MTNKWKDPHDNRAETAFINMPNLVEHTEEKNGFLKIQQLLFYNDLIEVLNNPDSIYNYELHDYAYWRTYYDKQID